MAEKKKQPTAANLMVAMPPVMKKELENYARKEMTSANAIVRRFVRDGLAGVKTEKK